jgi:DUF4097 and DUF4098 domain-containing protein YvlB
MNVSKLFCTVTLLLCTGAIAGDKIDEVLDVSATGQVSIENMRGDVKIMGWDKSQVSVSGELDDKAIGYTFETENDFTVFKVKMPKNLRGRAWRQSDGSDLTIYVPRDSNLSFESVNGNVSVNEITGGSNVHTVNGDITAGDLSKRIRLETVNGDIKASKLDGKIKLATVNGKVIDHDSTGKVTYTTVNGEIDSRTQAVRVYVENVNGEIDLDLKTTDELDVSTVNGDVDASLTLSNDGSVSVTTVGGSARLRLAGTVGGQFRLSSHAGGRITNNLTDDEVKKQKYGPGQSLKFSMAGGNARVEMTSVSGNLTLDKK